MKFESKKTYFIRLFFEEAKLTYLLHLFDNVKLLTIKPIPVVFLHFILCIPTNSNNSDLTFKTCTARFVLINQLKRFVKGWIST